MLRKLIPLLLLILSATSAAAINQVPSVSQLQPAGTMVLTPTQKINLGKDVYRGVVATAQLMPLANIEGGNTHLLVVSFLAEESGESLRKGAVAAKITSPDGKIGTPIRLNPSDDTFQAEIQLSKKGESLVKIGSKLADDKKRIYRFFYTPGL